MEVDDEQPSCSIFEQSSQNYSTTNKSGLFLQQDNISSFVLSEHINTWLLNICGFKIQVAIIFIVDHVDYADSYFHWLISKWVLAQTLKSLGEKEIQTCGAHVQVWWFSYWLLLLFILSLVVCCKLQGNYEEFWRWWCPPNIVYKHQDMLNAKTTVIIEM